MEESTKSIKEYVEMAGRHKRAMFIIFLLLFTVGLLFSRYLPATYVSRATILVEAQDIPTDLVRSTVTSVAAQRIQAISQRVMTRRNLLKIMDDTGIYAERRERETTDAVITRMREAIQLDMIEGTVAVGFGKAVIGTIAFTISFTGKHQKTIQKVTNAITTLFLDENLKERTRAAKETVAFLTREADALTERKDALGREITKFKIQHRENLPELHALNIQLLTAVEKSILELDDSLRVTENQAQSLREDLSITERHSLAVGGSTATDPLLRLHQYRTQLQLLQSSYGPEHPDVRRLKRTIAGLEEEVGTEHATPPDNTAELERLQQGLAEARKNYGEDHPDVVRLRNAITALESDSAATETSDETPAVDIDADTLPATNPVYRNLERALKRTEDRIDELKSRRIRMVEKHEKLEQRLLLGPQIEQEYLDLARDYGATVTRLAAVSLKQEAARVGQTIEESRKGERFTLIEPATLPEDPIKPNRPLLVILSLLVSVGSAIGYVAAVEGLDTSVRGPNNIIRILNVAPMAVIPYQATLASASARRKKKLAIVVAIITVIAALAGLLALLHFFVSPLDVLWFRILRKLSIILGITLL